MNHSFAQQYEISLPEKREYSANRFEVIGTNSDGIVTLSAGKSTHAVSLFSFNLKLKWKKQIALKEFGFINLGKIILTEDSAIVFFTVQSRGITLLKAAKVNLQLNIIRPAIILDTLSTSTLIAVPKLNYSISYYKKKFLVYYEDINTIDRRKLHAICIDEWLNVKWKINYQASQFIEPETITAYVDDSVNAWFLIGENQVKNFHNDFPYNKLMMLSYHALNNEFTTTITEENGLILSRPILKLDFSNRQIIICGLYSSSPGISSNGVYVNRYYIDGMLKSQKTIPFSSDLLSNLSGNIPPKRNDGFNFFHSSDLIIKNDGGLIFLTESYTVSTEAFNSVSGYGNFGGSSSLTVSYFHFDQIIALSFSNTDSVLWNQVLHKKQQTEGDGGIFSSYYLMVAPSSLVFIYNDFSSGTNFLSAFKLNHDGKVDRTEIFNADKKGLLPVSKSGKQISPDTVVVPSLKKGYLQFLKLTF